MTSSILSSTLTTTLTFPKTSSSEKESCLSSTLIPESTSTLLLTSLFSSIGCLATRTSSILSSTLTPASTSTLSST